MAIIPITHDLPKIAILGAGPSGLLLARLLQQNRSFPCTVTIFESDESPTARNQGGSLDLHPEHGQRALKEAGLWDQFLQHARPEADVMKVLDSRDTVLWDGNAMEKAAGRDVVGEKPEIDREALRSILLDSVEPGTVQWGRKVATVIPRPDQGLGKHEICFADGTKKAAFDLVVGADGAWSKARPLLTGIKPRYSGITALELWATNVDFNHPWLSQHVGAGSCFMFDEGRSVLAQRQGDGSIRVYGCVRKPEDWLETDSGLEGLDARAAAGKLIMAEFADCGEDIKGTVLESTDAMVPRKLWMLPVGLKWESKAGVTLVGDAAHLMTPFAGVGVNLALYDSLELSCCIAAHPDDLALAVQRYEESMFVYGKRFAEKTYAGLQGHFSAGGAAHLAARLKAGYEALRKKTDALREDDNMRRE